MPSHDMARFYALLPLFAILFVLNPLAFQAIAGAVGLAAGLHQLR